MQIQVKCSNSGVEPEMLARVRSVNVAWELYIGTLGKTSRTLGHGNLVKLLVLPIIADFQFLASFFLVWELVKLIVWSLFYINVCSDVVDNHDKIEIAILEPIKINKLELAHSFFPSIRVLYMFVVGEVLQRLLTLTLSKKPLSLLACPPPPDR